MKPRLEMLDDHKAVTAAISKGVPEAVLRHARLGQPVSTLRDGKVVWISPEEILARYAAENGEEVK